MTLIIGHRGASHAAPENTVAAFKLAREMGADGVELDTSLTRDGVPVVIHDLHVDKTTNGTGVVNSFDLKAIKALDAGSKFSAKFAGEKIPTLDEAFEAIGPDLIVNVELKAGSWITDGLERTALEVIRRHNQKKRVIVSSFNPMTLRRFRALAPDIPIGYLYSPDEPIWLRGAWFMIGVRHEARHPHHKMIDTQYMAWANQHGYQINTWTVDDPQRMLQLRDLGVHAIITNEPDLGLKTLGRS